MNFLRNVPSRILIGVILIVAACGGDDHTTNSKGVAASNPESALVVTSNYPLFFFASWIAEGVDDAPDVFFPAIEGDPALWVPDAGQIQQLQSADVVLLNGAGAESWLDLITLDRRRLVDTSANIADRLIPLEESVLHQHGPEGEHSHQGTAFTTWLDPQLAIAQAQSVTDALIRLAPSGEMTFRDNMARLKQELTQLDSRLAEALAKLDGRPVIFSHPVYQYLQRRYEINGQSVHWEPDQEPTTSAWIAMLQTNSTHRATTMIWEDEPLQSTAQRLANAGIASITFQTLANRPEEGDFLSVMRSNEKQLESILSKRGK